MTPLEIALILGAGLCFVALALWEETAYWRWQRHVNRELWKLEWQFGRDQYEANQRALRGGEPSVHSDAGLTRLPSSPPLSVPEPNGKRTKGAAQ